MQHDGSAGLDVDGSSIGVPVEDDGSTSTGSDRSLFRDVMRVARKYSGFPLLRLIGSALGFGAPASTATKTESTLSTETSQNT